MPRYVARASKPLYIETPLWDDNEPHRPHLEVDGARKVDTGLVSAAGDKIYRLPPPVGFGRDDEW